jgi:hypothetical protein
MVSSSSCGSATPPAYDVAGRPAREVTRDAKAGGIKSSFLVRNAHRCLVIWLCSDQATLVNGTLVAADTGWHVGSPVPVEIQATRSLTVPCVE